jgi:hypothetical protein
VTGGPYSAGSAARRPQAEHGRGLGNPPPAGTGLPAYEKLQSGHRRKVADLRAADVRESAAG